MEFTKLACNNYFVGGGLGFDGAYIKKYRFDSYLLEWVMEKIYMFEESRNMFFTPFYKNIALDSNCEVMLALRNVDGIDNYVFDDPIRFESYSLQGG